MFFCVDNNPRYDARSMLPSDAGGNRNARAPLESRRAVGPTIDVTWEFLQ